MRIDMWFKNDLKQITTYDVIFYPNQAEYRGNLYIGRKCVGDFTTRNSLDLKELEKILQGGM